MCPNSICVDQRCVGQDGLQRQWLLGHRLDRLVGIACCNYCSVASFQAPSCFVCKGVLQLSWQFTFALVVVVSFFGRNV